MTSHIDTGVTGSLRQIFGMMTPQRKRHFYSVLVLMVLGAFAELAAIGAVIPFLSLLADPTAIERMPLLPALFRGLGARDASDVIVVAALVFSAAAIIAGVVRILLTRSSQNFAFRLGHELGVEIQRRVLRQPYAYHISRNTSQFLASIEKVHILVFNVLLQIMLAGTAALISIFIIAGLIYLDPVASGVSGATFAGLYLLVTWGMRGRLARNSEINRESFDKRLQLLQESLGAIRDIIIDRSEEVYLKSFEQVDRRLSDARANTAFIGAAPRFVIESGGMVLIAVLAIFMTRTEGGLVEVVPVLGALALGAQRLLPLLQTIYYGWSLIEGNRAVVSDVTELLRLPVPTEERPKEPLPFRQQISFEKLSFFYPERDDPALSDINLTIQRGARVAFIGKTGSGKSTLIDLLMGLLEPTAGTITVDGTPLVGTAREAWQSNIAHVPQSIFLADTTIEGNIAFGYARAEIDPDRVRRAARQAQIHDFIEGLPQAYATRVGERGVRLSGGQRQRLGIARALYKEASVLILDEATSALDDETEAGVMQSLEHLDKLTIVMVAHRLSTVARCDIVYRLRAGTLVTAGTLTEVLEDVASEG